MTRAWDELAADVFDVVPPGLLLLILLTFAGLGGALWYWYPLWLPRPKPRKPATEVTEQALVTADAPVTADAEAEPELADHLAAEGRYAEAIRQRLRVTIGALVAARLVPPQPGWTAAELAAMAGGQRPAVAAPLSAATDLFSQIWYGGRPADRSHDEHMRTLTDQVRVVAS